MTKGKNLGPLNVNQLIKQLQYYRDKHYVLNVQVQIDPDIPDVEVLNVRTVNYNPITETIEIYGN